MTEDKSNLDKKLSADEKAAITRDLFERYRRGETTVEENEVIELLEEKFIPEKEFEISDDLIRELDNETKDFIYGRTGVRIKNPRALSPFLIGSIAAVALLLVGLFVLYRNHVPGTDTPLALPPGNASMQYISGNAVEDIVLPDGSRATLNKGTTLRLYESYMDEATREVWLDEGEVFFDIKPDEHRPFTVHLRHGLTVQVLGTSFNIQTYKELPFQEIAVLTGKIKVEAPGNKEMEVIPNQKAVFREETNTLSVASANSEQKTAWSEGIVVLENASLEELGFRIRQLYGKSVVFEDAPETISIHITLNGETSPEEVYTEIAALYHLSYRMSGEKIVFSSKTIE